jgi:hypothetical protein
MHNSRVLGDLEGGHSQNRLIKCALTLQHLVIVHFLLSPLPAPILISERFGMLHFCDLVTKRVENFICRRVCSKFWMRIIQYQSYFLPK